MSIISEYRLTHYSMKLLEYLMYYRGMTALQLTRLYYNVDEPLQSQKTNIHNYLSKLKKQSLVASKKLEDSIQRGSLYYLTVKGLDVVKEMLNIDFGVGGDGFILLNERGGVTTQADLPYSIYQPPRQQVRHHLLLIEFFIQLRIMFDEEESVDHRLSMYCSTTYTYDNLNQKIRPDAEILLPNQTSYWIEVDRGTENHSQLLQKFRNYKHYLTYLKENNLEIPTKGIIFVVDEKKQTYGLKRRWGNILSAFLKEMDPFQDDIRLILSPVNELENTLRFEMNRIALNQSAKHLVDKKLYELDYEKVTSFQHRVNKTLSYAFAINEKSYKIIFLNVSNAYDSFVYTNFHQFLQNLDQTKKNKNAKGLEYEGYEQIILHPGQQPPLISVLQDGKSHPLLEDTLFKLNQNVGFMQLDLNDV